MERITKIFTTFVVIFLLVWSYPVVACGCGLLVMESERGWDYGSDTKEDALIAYNDGIEHLLIGLDIQSRDTSAVLITPIPAAPEKVVADILSSSPALYGYDVTEKAIENLEIIGGALVATQIYPALAWYSMALYHSLSMTIGAMPVPGAVVGGDDGINVFQHLEKEGMIAEVLSAKTSEALYTYLASKGLSVERDAIPVFSDYINEDFSFVVAWIDPSKDNASARSLTMSFPTDKIFYPLKPNSAYKGKGMDKTIIVLGYVSPKLYAGIENETRVEYRYSNSGLTFGDFIDTNNGFGFTAVRVSANPQDMREDLYFSSFAPANIYFAHAINMHPFIFGLALLLLITYTATIVSLFLSKPQYKVERPKLAVLVGINCLTFIGTLVGAHRYLTTKKFKYAAWYSMLFIVTTGLVIFGLITFISFT